MIWVQVQLLLSSAGKGFGKVIPGPVEMRVPGRHSDPADIPVKSYPGSMPAWQEQFRPARNTDRPEKHGAVLL